MTSTPISDITAEADRLLDELHNREVGARLIGGLGVAAHDHVPVPRSLVREFADIDLVVPRKTSRQTAHSLAELGYTANTRFNALHGSKRMLFYDAGNRRQLDIFVGEFAMCHRLDLNDRLNCHPRALSAADLLLTKLQIVELNRKDVLDAARLLMNHELSDDDAGPGPNVDGLSKRRLLSVTASDWGWYTTLSDNLTKTASGLPHGLSDSDAETVTRRVTDLLQVMASAPKSARWKARALIGRRKAWYELPEEVAVAAHPEPDGNNPERTTRG